MKILFSARHPSYLRNFTTVIESLAAKGHEIFFVFDENGRLGEDSLFHDFLRQYETVDGIFVQKIFKRTSWRIKVEEVRTSLDYLRYFDPEYADAHKLRARVEKDVLPALRTARAKAWLAKAGNLKWAKRLARIVEWSLPTQPVVGAILDKVKPDMIVVTPLVSAGGDQVEWLREGFRRNLPVVLGVTSWDNLTNKGWVRIPPTKTLLWNDAQRGEAIRHHFLAPDSIEVCGAWSYAHWFTWKPSCSRADFMAKVGLPKDTRYLLYVGSSPFIAPNEYEFFREYARALLADPRLTGVRILVRPHPQNAAQWKDLEDIDGVTLFPRDGANPIDEGLKNDYFDTVSNAEAVMGINTSAMIEAGIQDKPVFTVCDARFADTQGGTLHFHHLTNINGGLLYVADTIEEGMDRLAEVLALSPEERGARSRRFIAAFVRAPGGGDPVACFVDALEAIPLHSGRRTWGWSLAGTVVRWLYMRRFLGMRPDKLSLGKRIEAMPMSEREVLKGASLAEPHQE
ncbi:MAG: hypothetical protein K9H25_01295 [Rhodospirillum sp.]|nr:hypothetical protein [Rhodospirillum sp.]MCF8488080.1 hypothetical protein [Rhodospirillum sp.]MCF8499876.1 hypothetical protein [Rhodospirillum sp.]